MLISVLRFALILKKNFLKCFGMIVRATIIFYENDLCMLNCINEILRNYSGKELVSRKKQIMIAVFQSNDKLIILNKPKINQF